jgi:hypothetical protein
MNGSRAHGTKRSEPETKAIWRPVRKLEESLASRKLLAMLQNTRRSYPTMKLLTRKGAFGAFTDEGTYLYVNFSGNLTDTEKRDLLALFATWLVADPDALLPPNIPRDG